jgi:hypothetical protein
MDNKIVTYQIEMQDLENTFITDVGEADDTDYTRYLYIHRQVMQSLFIALLEHQREEAIFWGYELYYSGYEEYVMEYIDSIYETIYMSCCSESFTTFFKAQYQLWKEDNSKEYILGILLWNLSIRNYDINGFIEQFFKVKCVKKPTVHNKAFRITMMDIDKYKTHQHVIGKGRFVIQEHCRYKIRNHVDELFKTNLINTKKKLHYHWLYYAYECPLWQTRILEHNGTKNDGDQQIEFEDDDMDNFYDLYGYSPDEQPIEIQDRLLGNSHVKQLSIKEFSEKYGGTMVCRKITRPNK